MEDDNQSFTIDPPEFTIPIKINNSADVDMEKLKEYLMSETEYKCPDCGGILLLESKYVDCEILYCPHCKKKVKAGVMMRG